MVGAEGNMEIDFSLGLPLDDGFGVDPTRKKLRLSSSGSNVVVTDNSLGNGRTTQPNLVALGACATTVRACSMPLETREGCRRNELQSVGTSSGLHADADGVSDSPGSTIEERIEEVKIVCVSHGLLLSPAEFVKHGGGGDVAHPLKHIVVIPFTL